MSRRRALSATAAATFVVALAGPAAAAPDPDDAAVAAHEKRSCAAVAEAFDFFRPGSKVFNRSEQGLENFEEAGIAFGCVPG